MAVEDWRELDRRDVLNQLSHRLNHMLNNFDSGRQQASANDREADQSSRARVRQQSQL